MRQSDHSPLGLYTIGIAALFLAGFLLLVVFGAQSYQKTVAAQNDNMTSRAVLSYLETTLKGHDTINAVHTAEYATGTVLIIREGDTGYAIRIYGYEGNLVEDFAKESAALHPEDAEIIGPTETFSVEEISGDVLRIRTDAGKVIWRSRTKGGGET